MQRPNSLHLVPSPLPLPRALTPGEYPVSQEPVFRSAKASPAASGSPPMPPRVPSRRPFHLCPIIGRYKSFKEHDRRGFAEDYEYTWASVAEATGRTKYSGMIYRRLARHMLESI
ncbi:hypothetical protein GQ602_005448 [Ophiocordyceps camponoti-floridani]|uniref:Uncharacterized protein n=1 Tax=Ophiocordyceps camponoti-floridani TaxID=2030778 RepID=A0A8H4Q3Q7_9HYPO|nr:hypothetical protein GQ602_005448 [Ophiocordyceps camponoti-floridani]